jgi:hypothetical protein
MIATEFQPKRVTSCFGFSACAGPEQELVDGVGLSVARDDYRPYGRSLFSSKMAGEP